MFIVKNTKIQGEEKTLSIGQSRLIKIDFQFEDAEFLDTDDFSLILGDAYSFEFAFKNNGFLSFRNVDVSDIITKSEQTFAIKVYQGEDLILDDSIIIDATIGDIDLSSYATKAELADYAKSSDLSDYATTSYVNTNFYNKTDTYTKSETNALFNNKLTINQITDDTDTIALAYNASYKIVEVDNTTNTASLTINPCTGYTAVAGEVPTFELWIKTTTKKTTISISNSIIQVGDLPTELDADMIHCFVYRFIGNNQLLNYAYSYTPAVESSESSESSSSN